MEGIKQNTMPPNYITPSGLNALKSELENLLKVERPKVVATVAWAASNGDRSENADYIYGKRRLREIDRRIGFLTSRIEEAEVVDPKSQNNTKVVFGALVTIEDENGDVKTYQIVGEDEATPDTGRISWKSPLAAAMLGKGKGEEVLVKKPQSDAWVEIIAIEFPS